MTKAGMRTLKINMIGAMNDYILHLDDERAYMEWIDVVPDCMIEEDAVEIAEDDELWVDTCSLFGKIVNKYQRFGEVVSES